MSGLGCAHTHDVPIPVVALETTPPAVRKAIAQAAPGQEVRTINHLPLQHGSVYRVYLGDKRRPDLLTLDAQGKMLEHAVVVRFASLPDAVQQAAGTAVAGDRQLCRKSLLHPNTYLIDYLLGGEEPVFAEIEENGFVRSVRGYAVNDPD